MLGAVLPALLPLADAYAQSRIGRLFSSPEQRIELDRIRNDPDFGKEAKPVVDEPEPETESGPEPEPRRPALAVTINGVVLRGGGHRVSWINGVETGAGTTSPAGVRIDAERAPDGRIRIRLREGGTSADLEPGQTIDVAKGRVFEAYEPRPARDTAVRSGDRAADSDAGRAGVGAAAVPDGSPMQEAKAITSGAGEGAAAPDRSPGPADPGEGAAAPGVSPAPVPPPALPAALVQELLRATRAVSTPPGTGASGTRPAGDGGPATDDSTGRASGK